MQVILKIHAALPTGDIVPVRTCVHQIRSCICNPRTSKASTKFEMLSLEHQDVKIRMSEAERALGSDD